MTKNFFLLVTTIIFLGISAFHFVRLALEWKISVFEWTVPGWVSGSIVILGIFMSYWSVRLSREEKKSFESDVSEETNNPEEE